ncbi:hypothetical protein BDV96DRAFT_650891 [Lophiotrema nucula]|uniref:Uncharacterized protein n=1 Tax=Lophiotrema nucula TaxID=690887 RepID=A0A6A5YUK1_9PLEO|nr:hypothetical protein BDV96DRAFT_650891 [Lophiotrema nucula]
MSALPSLDEDSPGFSSLPDETALKIAQELYICVQKERHSQPKPHVYSDDAYVERPIRDKAKRTLRSYRVSKYKELLNFCLLDRKCARVGQEVLLTYCDVATFGPFQATQLMRTLLERSALRSFVKRIKFQFVPSYSINGRPLFSTLEWKEHIALLTPLRNFLQQAGMDEIELSDCLSKFDSVSQMTMMRLLIALTPKVQELTVRSPDNYLDLLDFVGPGYPYTYKSMTGATWGPMYHLQCGRLQSLQHLSIRSCELTSLLIPLLRSKMVRLPSLKTLELHCEDQNSLRGNLDIRYDETVSQLLEAGRPGIDNLIIHGWPLVHQVCALVSVCKDIKSLKLVYNEFKVRGFGQREAGETGDIWAIVEMVKNTVEDLKIEFRREKSPQPFFIWPEGLQDCPKLKTLEIKGGFMLWNEAVSGYATFGPQQSFDSNMRLDHLDKSLKPEDCIPIAEEFLPPNIESFTYVPDRMATIHLDKYPSRDRNGQLIARKIYWSVWTARCFEILVRHGLQSRPALKSIKFAPLVLRNDAVKLVAAAAKEQGVDLAISKKQDEEKEMDWRYGDGWAKVETWRHLEHGGLIP